MKNVSESGGALAAERFFDLGEGDFWKSFTILIQLGAILAIVCLYFFKLWNAAIGMFTDPVQRRFVISVLVAFLPALVIGGLFGGVAVAQLPDRDAVDTGRMHDQQGMAAAASALRPLGPSR